MPVALITGASQGLGRALAMRLARDRWDLVIDARGAAALEAVATELRSSTRVVAVAGDVTDAGHRNALLAAARDMGGLDALVNNASTLGQTPLPALRDYHLDILRRVFEVNVVAPLALLQESLPLLGPAGGRVLNITSDAAVEAYEGWGGYGAAKAALEHVSRVLSVEQPGLRVYWVDPGDMNTRMHQEAFPGEDISDRPPPEDSVPGLLRLLSGDLPSGRYSARDVVQS